MDVEVTDAAAPDETPVQAESPRFTPVEVENPPPPVERAYTEEDLIAARKQEKEKLYPEIDRLKQEVTALKSAQEEEARRLAEEQQRLQDEARRKAEEEMDVRQLLQAKEAEWQSQLEAERQERERAFALLEKERQLAEVQRYRSVRIEEERNNIIPELIDLVSGDTAEQIDASIASLVERSSRIISSAQQAAQVARRDMSGARVTSPPAGPLEDYSDSRTMTPDQLRDMTMEEYAQYRSTLLGRGEGQGSGLFG